MMTCITHCLKDLKVNLDLKNDVLSSYTFRHWAEHFKVERITRDLLMNARVDFVLALCQERRLRDPDPQPYNFDNDYRENRISPNPDDGLRAGYNACLMVVHLDLMDMYPHVQHLHAPSSVFQLNALHIAARAGNERAVEILLNHDTHPTAVLNAQDSNGRTPLTIACQYGHTRVVQRLLRESCKSVDPHSVNKESSPTPHAALMDGCLDAVRAPLNDSSRLPLDLSVPDVDGWTALHYASQNGHFDIVRLLLAHPSDPPLNLNAANDAEMTPLHLAYWKGHLNIVQALLDHPSHPPVDVNAMAKDGWTLLHYASYEGNVSVVKQLLERGAVLNARTREGETPLMLASRDSWEKNREQKRAAESFLLSLPDVDLDGYNYQSDP